jgi:hypothetical protein
MSKSIRFSKELAKNYSLFLQACKAYARSGFAKETLISPIARYPGDAGSGHG